MSINLSQYDAVYLDLDGTIFHEDHPLPGGIELIQMLQRKSIPFACLTNSTSSPERLHKRLRVMGVEIPTERIHTAGAAAVDYVLERFGRMPRVFNLATESVQEMFAEKVTWIDDEGEPCDAIVIGTPSNVYATNDRQRVALSLARAGALLVGACADRVFPSKRGIEFGAGALTSMLAYAAASTPFFCGKPQPIFFNRLCERMGVAPQRCVLIGDNLESDIAGAHGVQMQAILTLTGVTTSGKWEHLTDARKPDAVVTDLNELLVALK